MRIFHNKDISADKVDVESGMCSNSPEPGRASRDVKRIPNVMCTKISLQL